MYCAACGALNADTNMNCGGCGAALPGQASMNSNPQAGGTPPQAPVHVPNNMVGAVLSTLCCCLPLGVVAIIYAAQVNTKIAAGDIAGAQAASKNASTFTWLSVILGFVFGVLYFFAMIAAESGY